MERAILALALVLAGCAASGPDASPEPSTPTPSDGDPEAEALGPAGTPLEPGRYTREEFDPRITFEVGDGWTAEQVATGFFDVQQDVGSLDVIAVQFANVLGEAEATEILAGMEANETLVVSEPEPVSVDGVTGVRAVVETTDPPDTEPPIFRQVLTVAAGPISIASGRRLQITLLDGPGGVLAILVGGSIAEWDRTLEVAMPVVESVTIGE